MPTILISGGLGYIGGRVAIELHQEGYKIICGTRRDMDSPPVWLPEMKMVTLNWDSEASLVRACQPVDSIIHLAAMNEVESLRDPAGALLMNGMASLRLLEAAKKTNVKRFIYFSTAHVYGSPLKGEINEKTLPRPIHPYAITHKVTEDFVLAAHSQRLIEGVVIRLSNGFGAPATASVDRWTLLVNDLCRQVVVSGGLRLNSSGLQERDFITLGDVTNATNHLLQLDSSQLDDGLFNLGGMRSISILDMTKMVASRWFKMTGINPPIVCSEGSPSTSPPLTYSCQKLLATGFELSSLVEEEIDATLRLCQDAFGANKI
jgi:UDP-glucose 4-epimerase